jgi:hypothetical protein
MKKILLVALLPISFFSCKEPEKKSAGNDTPTKSDATVKVLPPVSNYTNPDRSPMDMVYFPTDYPLLKMAGKTTASPLMRIIYSRPQKQGRQIFGGLVQYDMPWRLGANEATEIEFFLLQLLPAKPLNLVVIFYTAFRRKQSGHLFSTQIYTAGALNKTGKKTRYNLKCRLKKQTLL